MPLPNDFSPTIVARPASDSAAVMISEAEAVSPLISTTIGRSGSASPTASKVCSGEVRPSVETMTPSSTNRLEFSTASSSRPPPLPRRSSTRASAPSSSRRSTSCLSWAWAPREKLSSSTWAILCPSKSSSLPSTTGTASSSRVSVSSRSSPVEGRSTVIVTSVPALPLISAVARSGSSPAIDLPSTSVTMSPWRIPASFAGEPSNVLATRRPRLTPVTLMPTPEKLPSVSSWKRSKAAGPK